jgi:hypothetical protein
VHATLGKASFGEAFDVRETESLRSIMHVLCNRACGRGVASEILKITLYESSPKFQFDLALVGGELPRCPYSRNQLLRNVQRNTAREGGREM